MSYQTVIFDLDGTLLNTLEDLSESVNYALTQEGFPPRAADEIRKFVGNGVKALVSLAVPEGTTIEITEKCFKTFYQHYAEHIQNKTQPYDGIYELLQDLKAKGYSMGIVSNKYDEGVKALCRDYFKDYVQVAIGESEAKGIARKPAPDSVLAAMKQLGAQNETSIYIGDTEVDVQTAHNAGIKCVGVTWGFRDREILTIASADYIIDHPNELIELLNRETT